MALFANTAVFYPHISVTVKKCHTPQSRVFADHSRPSVAAVSGEDGSTGGAMAFSPTGAPAGQQAPDYNEAGSSAPSGAPSAMPGTSGSGASSGGPDGTSTTTSGWA